MACLLFTQLNEIVDTEKNYVKLLETIIQHFMVPLEKQTKIITKVPGFSSFLKKKKLCGRPHEPCMLLCVL